MRIKNRKTYTMDKSLAGETLQNIFNACDIEPSRASLDCVMLNRTIDTRVYTIGKWITIIMLILTFVSPLFFPHSPVKLNQVISSDTYFTIDSHYVINGNLYLVFYGEKIDPQNSYMLTDSCFRFTPTSYNEEKNMISFPYGQEEANIYIESKDGTTLHFLMSPKEDS